MGEATERNQTWLNNQGYVNPNILKFRLDTTELIQSLQKFLSGKVHIPQQQPDGTIQYVVQTVGEQVCNDKGQQMILNYVQSIVNPSVVQGNYNRIQYENHVDRIHHTVSRQLLANYHVWGIKYENLEFVNDFIINLVEAFLTRLIDNEERLSYNASLKVAEASRVEQSGGWNPFGGRK